MIVKIEDRANGLRERLRARLADAERLRCAEHAQPVFAVTIHGRENGWFDCSLTTCCERLQEQAAAIMKQRC